MTPIEAIVLPIGAGRELRLSPIECLPGQWGVFLSVWERGADGLYERNDGPILVSAPVLRLLASAATKMATRLEKVNARQLEDSVWRPA